MGDHRAWGRAVLAVALLWLVVAAPAAAGVQVADGDGAPVQSQVEGTQDTPTPEGNGSVVHHKDPDRVGSDTSYSDYASYLASSLAGRLGESTIRVSEDDYERARELLGEEYTEDLRRYGDVVELTRSEGDEESLERFERTAETQRSFASDVQRFDETVEEYREARQNGNTSRARTLAHRLDVLIDEIDMEGRQLRSNYTDIADAAGVDLSNESRTVGAIVDAKRAEVDEIEEAEFVPTRLVVESATREVSFREPLRASGRVETENGTAIPNARVRVGSAERRVETTTAPNGSFSLTYHPTVLPLSTRELTVEYVPQPTSPYGGSNATVPVTVSQVAPTVTVEPSPDGVRYGETLNVTGHVGAAGVDAAGVPVVVTLDRERVGRVETNATGAFRVRTTVPAGLEPGDQPVRVGLPLAGRALAPSNATAAVLVNATATSVSVSGSQTDEGVREVAVAGRLATDDGRPLAGRAVEVVFDGRPVATVTTGSDGRFERTVTVPRSALPSRPGGVTQPALEARFDGTGTNLASSTATTRVAMEANVSEFVQVNWDRLIAVGALLAALLVGRLWYDRRGGSDGEDVAAASVAGADDGEEEADGATLMERAREAFDAGRPDEAIQLAYVAARRRLVDDLGRPGGETHWEFYRRCRAAGLGDAGRLEGLTRLYERAAFDRRPAGRELAAEAIESASSLLEGGADGAGDDAAAAD